LRRFFAIDPDVLGFFFLFFIPGHHWYLFLRGPVGIGDSKPWFEGLLGSFSRVRESLAIVD
jgi:hypothetical protein